MTPARGTSGAETARRRAPIPFRLTSSVTVSAFESCVPLVVDGEKSFFASLQFINEEFCPASIRAICFTIAFLLTVPGSNPCQLIDRGSRNEREIQVFR